MLLFANMVGSNERGSPEEFVFACVLGKPQTENVMDMEIKGLSPVEVIVSVVF